MVADIRSVVCAALRTLSLQAIVIQMVERLADGLLGAGAHFLDAIAGDIGGRLEQLLPRRARPICRSLRRSFIGECRAPFLMGASFWPCEMGQWARWTFTRISRETPVRSQGSRRVRALSIRPRAFNSARSPASDSHGSKSMATKSKTTAKRKRAPARAQDAEEGCTAHARRTAGRMPTGKPARRGCGGCGAHRARRRLADRQLLRAARPQSAAARGAADRSRRADAVSARPVRRASQEAVGRDRSHRFVPRSGHRDHRAGGGLLDAERAASAGGDAPPRREIDHRAGGAEARDRVADPRAQYREGAQPARALARGDPHLQGSDRGGCAAAGKRFRVLPRGGGAGDARAVLRAQGQFRRRRLPLDPAAPRGVFQRAAQQGARRARATCRAAVRSSTSSSPKSSRS